MKKAIVKALCLALVCICGNVYAENSETYTWEWDYKSTDLTVSSATGSPYGLYGWSSEIIVYACPNKRSISGAVNVGSGSFSNSSSIHLSITNYYSDKYYCVCVRWSQMGELQAVYYYYCEETQKDAFYATVSSVNVSKYCESDFSATLTATVECGSGSYSYSWDITNGSAYSGHSTSTLSVVHANANGAPKCYTDVTKNKKCTITVTDKVWKTSGGTSSTTSGSYTLGSLRFTPNTFVGPSCEFDVPYGWYGSTVTGNSASIGSNRGNGYGTLTYTWYKSTSPDGSYSAISNSNAQSLSITRPANTTFYKQYATNSSCPSETYHDGYTTTNGKDYFICVVPIAATASPSSASTYYGGSVSLSCSSTGGRVSKTYKWYSSTSSGGTYSVIQGATSASYTPTSLTATQYYKCMVADDDHPSGVYSNVVTVSVRSQLVAGSISGGGTTYSGGSVRLTASAATGGNGSYGYQWQVYNGSQWSDMSGKTSLTCDVSESNTGTTNLSKNIV